MSVRYRKEDGLGEQGSEEQDLLLMTGGAEPAAFAGEGQEMIFLAMIAADAGEPAFEVTTVKELIHHLGNDRPQVAVARLVALFVDRLKGVVMPE